MDWLGHTLLSNLILKILLIFIPSLTTYRHLFTSSGVIVVVFTTDACWDAPEVGFLDLDLEAFLVFTAMEGGGGIVPTSIVVDEIEEVEGRVGREGIGV